MKSVEYRAIVVVFLLSVAQLSVANDTSMEIEYLLPGHMDIVTGIARVADNFDYVKKQILQWL